MKNKSNNQEQLLNSLIQQVCSTLPEYEMTIERSSLTALIWNLFKGNYKFSAKDVTYIIETKNKSDNKI